MSFLQEMKRNALQSNEILLQLPGEVVFGDIHTQVKACCLRVCEFLNWHATCRGLWLEYMRMDDDTILGMCRAKKEKNKSLLLKTLNVVYKTI